MYILTTVIKLLFLNYSGECLDGYSGDTYSYYIYSGDIYNYPVHVQWWHLQLCTYTAVTPTINYINSGDTHNYLYQ